ncbi:glycoside hydrolase family 92 protein [Niastella caeni]|uniref:Glycoside hydrolase family 92 protein n=1 Tax=Niastella caeni TaxID=2569763 RepID=A0A4S8HZ01_9BACT|nr:GH92 family glycosyl hydrolase [Niastella caeni]THU41068.1 glycoside hydrolase family 92 protein [Niastella caeni]
MKKFLPYAIITILTGSFIRVNSQDLVQYVQPLAGTAPSTTTAAQKHSEAGSEKNANTIPAVGLPFGMTQWTPQTRTSETKCIPPYFYKDSLINGFRGTHWISGSCMQDYGSVTIMPVTGALRTTNFATPFSHQQEIATPAYYKVELPAYHCVTEITSTARCGMMQFTLQQDDSLYLLVMPNSDRGEGALHIDAAKGEVWGYNPVHRIYQGWGNKAGFSGYFFIQFEKVPVRTGSFSEAAVFSADSIGNQKNIGVFAGFNFKKGEQLRIRIGTSFSSVNEAKRNLRAEITTWNFNPVWESAKQSWEEALSQVQVQGNSEKDKRIFYTAMYHALQHPRLFSDVDGVYPSFAGGWPLKKLADGQYYDDFSMWDIYRAQLPLLQILQPARVNQFVSSMILKGEQGGWLPIFPCWNSFTAAMIGDHVTAFIASSWAKGIRNYDIEAAYRLMRQNAFDSPNNNDYVNGKGRRALQSYLQYGYIPMEDSVPEAFHKKEQVSRTLEYAYDDYALAIVAKGLNKTADYTVLHKRAFNYKNIFDTTVGLVRGKYSDGRWYEPFNPDKREPYITEGTPRQYTFYVPQDVAGLASLMGGAKALENSLDTLFAKNEYWHGNEPGHQIPFMYNYTASPWKTQQVVRNILSEEYSDGPGGLSGNDDAGQMSAWYIFAAIGLYPVDPVSGEHLLCSPIFDKVTLQLAGNKKLQIVCHKRSAGDAYIQQVRLNGKTYQKSFVPYANIMKGGVLDIYLQSQPSAWGTAVKARPSGLTLIK